MSEPVFEMVVPYWPARVAMYWWERPDLNVRSEFEAARAGGAGSLAVDLMWNDFQPYRDRVAVPPMRHLERVLEVAADHDMQVRLTLFPVTIGSLLWLPAWALQTGTLGSRRVISGHHLTSMVPYNLFADGRIVDAQQRLVREIVSAFADHPSISGWVLGRGLSAASFAPSAEAFGRWIDSMATEARRAGAMQHLWFGIGAEDLTCQGVIAPELAAAAGVTLEVTDDWAPDWSELPRLQWAGFLAAYARALSGSPVSIAGLGDCTSPLGIRRGTCPPEAEVAEKLETCLDAVYSSGGGGAAARSLMDYSDDLAHSPPFRQDPALLTSGLLTCDAVPKEPLLPWAAWARGSRSVRPALDLPDPDPEQRHRDPEEVARDFYEVYR